MSHGRLVSVAVERFKSYGARAQLDLKPLTVLVGRNNSGKSTMMQALLLLKQTLESPRADVSLSLVGAVEALNLRELTHGWPEVLAPEEGPIFQLVLDSRLDVARALAATQNTSERVLMENGIPGLQGRSSKPVVDVRTTMTLRFQEESRRGGLASISLYSHGGGFYPEDFHTFIQPNWRGHQLVLFREGPEARGFGVEWDHFLPHLTLDRSGLGPRDKSRIDHNLWLFRMEQPLEDLRAVLRGFGFLGSTRAAPPTLYRASASEPPDSVGLSGEYAAEILHARRSDVVHYLPPLSLDGAPAVSEQVRALPLMDAVNDVLQGMGIEDNVTIDDIKDVGFRLLVGKATLQHVGRGLTYLLPLVAYGLLLDPKRFDGAPGEQPREEFLASLTRYSLAAFEEPEAHIHPKLQAQLAHWFVALAMCGRNLVVETHSDHLVRRLRGLIARAKPGSFLEQWLRENVSIVEVSKGPDGASTLAATALDTAGGFERWPADFMDAATDEEREIYDASLEKPAPPPPPVASAVVHDVGDEPPEA